MTRRSASPPYARRADHVLGVWTLIVVTIGSLGMAVLLGLYQLHQRERDQDKAEIQRLGRLLAMVISSHPAWPYDTAAIGPEVETLGNTVELGLSIVSADGRLVAGAGIAGGEPFSIPIDAPEIDLSRTNGTGVAERSDLDGVLRTHVAVPIRKAGAITGYVVALRKSPPFFRPERGGQPFLVYLTGAGTLIVLVAVRATRRVTRHADGLIAEIEAASARQQASEAGMAEAQRLARIGSWEWEISTNTVSWSNEHFRLFGLEPGTVTPSLDLYLQHVQPDDRVKARATLDLCRRHGGPFSYHQQIVRADNVVRTLYSRGETVCAADGRPTRLRGTVQDVTEQRAAAEALRQSEHRFHLAALASSEALCEWNIQTGALWLNESFTALFGHPVAHQTVELWKDLIHANDVERVERSLQQVFASRGSLWSEEYRLRRADGTYAWVFDRGFIERDITNRPVRMIASLMDITHRKEAERLKSDFVSFVSHQLRTPLAGMNWMLELAAECERLPSDAHEYISNAREAAARLVSLVNDLLDIARLEAGRIVMSPEPVLLADATQSVLTELESLIAEKGLQVSVDADGAATVLADPQLVRQVVMNLISNAIKYNNPGGRLDIRIAALQDALEWSVRDTGMGIPRAAQSRLFEKFFRADNAVAQEVEGTGLGLHLVRLIIEQAGGRVWCESEQGAGALFAFTLPVAQQRVH
jgi:PAS domain S-box-containing protein